MNAQMQVLVCGSWKRKDGFYSLQNIDGKFTDASLSFWRVVFGVPANRAIISATSEIKLNMSILVQYEFVEEDW